MINLILSIVAIALLLLILNNRSRGGVTSNLTELYYEEDSYESPKELYGDHTASMLRHSYRSDISPFLVKRESSHGDVMDDKDDKATKLYFTRTANKDTHSSASGAFLQSMQN